MVERTSRAYFTHHECDICGDTIECGEHEYDKGANQCICCGKDMCFKHSTVVRQYGYNYECVCSKCAEIVKPQMEKIKQVEKDYEIMICALSGERMGKINDIIRGMVDTVKKGN